MDKRNTKGPFIYYQIGVGGGVAGGWWDLRGGGGHEKNMALERGQTEKCWI